MSSQSGVELFENGRRTSKFSLTREELDSSIDYHIGLAKIAIREEQQKGNLLEHNVFVDGKVSPTGSLDHVKFAGRITYDEINALQEVTDFINKLLARYTPVSRGPNGGSLRFSQTWYVDGKPTRTDELPEIIRPGTQLVTAGMIRYAKYIEAGTVKNRSFGMYKKAADAARRRFGAAFIITHQFMLGASFKPRYNFGMRHRDRRNNWIYSPAYYKERWKNAFPSIKVVQKRNVAYY